MEDGIEQKLSTVEEKEQHDLPSSSSQLKNPTIPILIFLGVILATLSVIVAGYFHGKMNIGAVWHNLHNFS